MCDIDLPAIEAVQRLILQPGEVLVVRCPDNITIEQAHRVKELVSEKLRISPDRVLVLGNGIAVEVVKTAPDIHLNIGAARTDKEFIEEIIRGIRRAERVAGRKIL